MSASEPTTAFVSVALYIRSRTLTATAISDRLGLEPTSTWLKGQAIMDPVLAESVPLPAPSNYFVLEIERKVVRSSPDSSARALENAIEELLLRIEPVADRLERLQEEASLTLMCAYGSYQKPEWFMLSRSLLHRTSALNLSLTVCLVPVKKAPDAN
jgi:hypothetical protein